VRRRQKTTVDTVLIGHHVEVVVNRALRTFLVAAAALTLGSAVACAGGSSPSGGVNAAESTATSAPSSTAAPPAGESTATSASPARCHSRQLAGTNPVNEGAAGSVIVHIALKNVGTASCTVSGYLASVLLFDGAGTPLPTTVTRESGEHPTVVLAPGASATALLRYQNPDLVDGCGTPPRSHSLLVTPPGETLPLLVHSAAGLTPCAGKLFTVPVRP
jgi:hypothetical protein